MDTESVFRFMQHYRYGVVSSVSADGVPQSALVGIAVTPKLEDGLAAAATDSGVTVATGTVTVFGSSFEV